MAEIQVTQDVIETLGGVRSIDVTQDTIEYLYSDFTGAPAECQLTQDVLEFLYSMTMPVSPGVPECAFASAFVPGVRRAQGVCE